MKSREVSSFLSDKPIQRVTEDKLGREFFSKQMAEAISNWKGKESLVISINGDWGSGKTSIKNLMTYNLENSEGNRPAIVEFTPWEWATQANITESFFHEISISVSQKDKSENGNKLASLLEKYGNYLIAGESLTTGLATALPTLFILASLTGLGGNLSDETWIKTTSGTIIAGLLLLAAFLKWGGTALQDLTKFSKNNSKTEKTGMNDVRKELRSLLTERDSALIIIIDDLDRLTPEQLKMTFQLVKANLDFPNIVFILLFQRDIVEEKLTEHSHSGREYLEKIIQVPIDIPKSQEIKIREILFENINSIIKQSNLSEEKFETERWGDVFYGSLFVHFKTLRSVYRYTSTLSFYFPMFNGRSAFEVSPVDLIAIECLRVFEPDVYKTISQSKPILTNGGLAKGPNGQQKAISFIANILDSVSEEKKASVKKTIFFLFPDIESAFDGANHYINPSDSGLKEMRICHQSVFDKYFLFSIPDGELSNSDLNDMVWKSSNTDEFSSFIMSLQDKGILKSALSQFEDYSSDKDFKSNENYIKSLIDVGDKVDHKDSGFATLSTNHHIVRLCLNSLRRVECPKERGSILLNCFESSTGFSVVSQILNREERNSESGNSELLFRDEEFSALKEAFVEKMELKSKSEPSSLINHTQIVPLAIKWMRWGDESNVKTWVQSQLKTRDDYINFLNKFISRSHTYGSDGSTGTTEHIRLDNIEIFLEIEVITEKISDIEETQLDTEAQETINAFKVALDKREKGIEDDW